MRISWSWTWRPGSAQLVAKYAPSASSISTTEKRRLKWEVTPFIANLLMNIFSVTPIVNGAIVCISTTDARPAAAASSSSSGVSLSIMGYNKLRVQLKLCSLCIWLVFNEFLYGPALTDACDDYDAPLNGQGRRFIVWQIISQVFYFWDSYWISLRSFRFSLNVANGQTSNENLHHSEFYADLLCLSKKEKMIRTIYAKVNTLSILIFHQ